MRRALVKMHGIDAGVLEALDDGSYKLSYLDAYDGPPISLALPTSTRVYSFESFPAYFDGLLPEGIMLEALLRKHKLDKRDYFGQLLKVGGDLVGAVTVETLP